MFDFDFLFSIMEDVLSEKYTSIFLTFLLSRGKTKKGDFREVINSTTTIDKLVTKFEKEGFITVEKEFAGRRIHQVSLTLKGRAVAEQLRKAEEAAKGMPPSEEPRIIIEKNDKGEEIYVITPEYRQFAEERRKRLSALIHVNVLDDHISFKETNYEGTGRDRIVTIYVKLNGNGILRLWCEVDESYDCWHVSEAWSLPEVREMYFNQVKKGNIKE